MLEIGEALSLRLKDKLLSMAIVGAVMAIGLMLLGVRDRWRSVGHATDRCGCSADYDALRTGRIWGSGNSSG